MASIIRNWTLSERNVRPTVGDSKLSFTDLDHMGWLKCDGRLVNVADYISLFKVIGYTFGGSGTQFKLPDMRGRIAGSAGTGAVRDDANRALSTRTKGQYLGEEIHQLTIGEMPAHKHGSVDVSGNTNGNGNTSEAGSHDHGGTTGAAGSAAESETVGPNIVGGPNVAGSETHTHTISADGNHTHTIGSTGGNGTHNNMQPTLFLGNTFIYCGLVSVGAYPLQIDTDII